MSRMKMFNDVINKTLNPPQTRQNPGLGNFGFRTELGARSFRPLVRFSPRMPGMPTGPKPMGTNRNVLDSAVNRLAPKI